MTAIVVFTIEELKNKLLPGLVCDVHAISLYGSNAEVTISGPGIGSHGRVRTKIGYEFEDISDVEVSQIQQPRVTD
jgi:hypothetical protein